MNGSAGHDDRCGGTIVGFGSCGLSQRIAMTDLIVQELSPFYAPEVVMSTEVSPKQEEFSGGSLAADHPNLMAMIWIVVAWIVGSLVFEVTATGAEFPIGF